MRAAAEFQRIFTHFNNTDGIAVLFAEQRRRTELLRLGNRQNHRFYRLALQNHFHDFGRNLCQFLRCNGRKVRKVETQMIRLHKRTGLMAMFTQHTDKRTLQ